MEYLKTVKFFFFFIVVFQCHSQRSDFNHINFKKADSIALAYNNEDLFNLPKLSYQLTSNLSTDVERFRAIYMWVCSNIKNNYNLYLKNNKQRKRFKNNSIKLNAWNERFKKKMYRKLLNNEETICTGYAYLIKELSDLANLNCEIVHGYARISTTNIDKLTVPNHSWNSIKLNDKWYFCDATWASGIVNLATNEFTFQYNDGYFLTHPSLFVLNHYPIDKKWLLLEEASFSFETFLKAPLIYNKAYTNLSIHILPKKMHQTVKPKEEVIFKYKLSKALTKDQVYFVIDNGYSEKKIHPNSIIIEHSLLKLKHQFNKHGIYDVHFYIGEDLISTYIFDVKK